MNSSAKLPLIAELEHEKKKEKKEHDRGVFLIIPGPVRGCMIFLYSFIFNNYINIPKGWGEILNHPFHSTPYHTLFFLSNNQPRCAGRSEDDVDGQKSQNALSFVHTRALSSGGW